MKYLKDVATLKLDEQKCIGCGMCAVVCPHAVFLVDGGKAVVSDRDSCMECGACALNCPASAISVDSGVGCATGIIASAFPSMAACCGGDACCCAPKNDGKSPEKPADGNVSS